MPDNQGVDRGLDNRDPHIAVAGGNDDMTTPKSKRTTSPAFQFYPESWFSSSKVSRMSHTERGIYIDLLARCWLDNGLPTDLKQIAALVGLPVIRFQKIWIGGALSECFIERGGRLVNPRQERERQKQLEFRRRQTDNGGKGGRPRKNPNETQAFPKQNPTTNQPVSVSKARALETEIETETSVVSSNKIGVPEFDGQLAFMRLNSEYPSHRGDDSQVVQSEFIQQLQAHGPTMAAAFAVMLDNLRNQKASEEWQRGIIPNLENWLTKGKWKRRYENQPASTSKTAGNRAAIQRFIDRGKAS